MRRLLLRTSPLDRVNGELGDRRPLAGSERVLLDLEDANAFVVSLDPGRTWFRYHHLFRGLLELELRRTAAADIPGLHRLAADWLAGHGEVADAIRHLQAAGDWTEAAGLLTDHALSLTLDGQAGTVAALLRAFPAKTGEEPSGLALVHAIADLDRLRLDRAAGHLSLARASPPGPRPPGGTGKTAIVALNLLSARLRGNFDGVFEQVDALPLAIVGESSADIALNGDLRALALMNLGVTEAWSLRLADSERHLLEGAALARDIGRPYLEVACLAHLGYTALGQSLALARGHCEEAIALAAKHGWDAEPVIAPAQATLGGILVWTGEFDHGERWLDRARRATRSGGEPGIRLLVHRYSAALCAARGQHRDALAEFAAAGQVQARMAGVHALPPGSPRVRSPPRPAGGHRRRGSALAALDDRQAAAREIRNAAAAIRLAEHGPAGARCELLSVLGDGVPAKPYLTMVEAHLLDALAQRDLGDARAARAAVERALDLAERTG